MFRSLCVYLAFSAALVAPDICRGAENRTLLSVQEEIWALPLIHPTVAYVVHPTSKTGVAKERESKGVALFVPVLPFAQGDERVRFKGR